MKSIKETIEELKTEVTSNKTDLMEVKTQLATLIELISGILAIKE